MNSRKSTSAQKAAPDRRETLLAALWNDAADGLAGIRVDGGFERSPLAPSIYRAELDYVPMARAQDYASITSFEWPSSVPVLMSPSQRSRILADLVNGLRMHVEGLGAIAIQLYGPDFNIPLPAALLAADVILVHAPLGVVPAMLAAGGKNIVAILQDLRADSVEPGCNRLSLLLIRPEPAAAALESMLAFVQGHPHLRAMHGLRVQGLDEAALAKLLDGAPEPAA